MKLFLKKNLNRIFILFISGGLFLIVLYSCLVLYVEKKIENQLATIEGKTSSIHVNLFSRSVHVENLEVFPSESMPLSLRLKMLKINGIHLYQLLVHDKILINGIQADSGKIIYSKPVKKEESKRFDSKFKSISVQNFSLMNIVGEVRTDTVVDISAIFNFSAKEIFIETDSVMKYSMKAFDGDVHEINISRNSGMYRMRIANFRFNSDAQKIIVDSIFLIPNYGKYEFAHQLGEQTGRVNLIVPRLMIEGIEIENIFDSTFTASRIEITSFNLHSFKDKRVPFLRTRNIPLPMESFSKLPFTIAVDSMVITDSRITIEELAENGTESGLLTFEHVNAHASRFSNKYKKNDRAYATLNATGLLMGSGEVNASFSFPLDGSPTYRAKGSISRLPFEKLNPLLENLIRLRIESGKLNNLKFDFQYTDLQSVGAIEIDYENLKITSLKRKNNDTNEFKTLIINTFLKKDKSRSLSKLKRTGSINIERDRKRYVFNIWWKSILDGLKSTVLRKEDQKT